MIKVKTISIKKMSKEIAGFKLTYDNDDIFPVRPKLKLELIVMDIGCPFNNTDPVATLLLKLFQETQE